MTGDPPVDGEPVYELRFCVQGGRDLPLPDANGGMGTLRARGDRSITYFARRRHHRVIQTFLDRPTVEFWVPETWCCYEPLNGQKIG